RAFAGHTISQRHSVWVPAFAGTTADSSVTTTVEDVTQVHKRGSTAAFSGQSIVALDPCGLAKVGMCGNERKPTGLCSHPHRHQHIERILGIAVLDQGR